MTSPSPGEDARAPGEDAGKGRDTLDDKWPRVFNAFVQGMIAFWLLAITPDAPRWAAALAFIVVLNIQLARRPMK
jgi:hypothetical protein